MLKRIQERSFIIETALFIVLLYCISIFVFLNGDDFMYGTFAKQGIFSSVWSYYQTGNGCFITNVLDSALLTFDRYLFILINPLIIMAFIVLLAKNVQWLQEKKLDSLKEKTYICYGMVLFSCVDIMCLRETVFWITGMMNYLFPAVVFLFALWVFQIIYQSEDTPIYKKVLYCFLCLFASSTVEQYALMFVGVMTIVLFKDILVRNKIQSCLLIGFAVALVGLVSLILAPGNFIRIENQQKIVLSFLDNFWTLVYQNTFSPVSFPFLFMLTTCSSIHCIKNTSQKNTKFFFSLLPAIMLCIYSIPYLHKAILISVVLVVVLAQLLYTFIVKIKNSKVEIFSLSFVGIGSQIMLLISVIWGFRCMFSMYMIYMLLILFELCYLEEKYRLFILCSGILISLNPLALVLFLIWLLIRNKGQLRLNLQPILIRSSVMISLLILVIGYGRNAVIHIENIKSTSSAVQTGEAVLYELRDDTYSWYFIPMIEFHENYYRRYYNLPDFVKIKYIENENRTVD